MKTSISAFILVLIMAMFASVPRSLAMELKDVRFRSTWHAELTRFNLDEKLAAARVQAGQIEIDEMINEATLSLIPAFYCPPGRFCAQVVPMPITISLPIVSKVKDECGSKIIVARNGNEELMIRDNAKNKCAQTSPTANTEVVYSVEAASKKMVSTFSGERFVRLAEAPLDIMVR
jgi:hypothetical protein